MLLQVLLASPFSTYILSTISFPLRIFLSEQAGIALSATGADILVEGNLIILNGNEFLVDEACAGLYMLRYAFLFGFLIVGLMSRENRISVLFLVLSFSFLLGLILTGNLTRIIILILFNIPAATWLHDGIGIVIFLIQILIPFYFVVRFIPQKPTILQRPFTSGKLDYIVPLSFISLLLFYGDDKATGQQQIIPFTLTGYSSEPIADGVTKLTREDALLYLKEPVPPFRSDHSPAICWRGSGFVFSKIQKFSLNGRTINMAELKKGNVIMYTSWWFVSEDDVTDSQWEWRKNALLKNRSYYLVNLTCATKEQLIASAEQLFRQSL